MSRRLIHLLLRLACCAAAVLAFALAIAPGDPGLVSYDKANHGLAFGTLGVLARLGWSRTPAWKPFVLLVAFGGAIELVQAMPVVGRDGSWGDLFADTVATAVGLLVGAGLIALARRRPG